MNPTSRRETLAGGTRAVPGPGGGERPMGCVRPLVPEDIPRIAELYRSVFGPRNGVAPAQVASYLHEILFQNPWRDPELPSLTYEDGQGRIIGCLGVMPRRMSIAGVPIQAAISHSFMVEPTCRASLAGVELGKAFLAGRQDLSMAEGGDVSRRMMEGFGGSTALLFSLRWTRPLRPTRYVLSFLKRRRLPGSVAAALVPICYAADALGTFIRGGPLRLPAPRLAAEELQDGTLLGALGAVTWRRSLRPEYDAESLRWLLDLLGRKRSRGALQKVALRNASREIVGWYLYYLNPGGISEVVQIAARDGLFGTILDHLLYHAWHRGSVAVSGQLDPLEIQAFWERSCVFHHDGASWVLVHARRREVLEAIHRGDAFLTRLEGEWWIGL